MFVLVRREGTYLLYIPTYIGTGTLYNGAENWISLYVQRSNSDRLDHN